ncbi:hypothetical protein Mnod_2304 [Methylobacterium nodulans ORS 2060]|uniref:Uncharacterized protein n=1 Tax=Methylobacterium nodulans (strain LMG 21967 / CNCM I-2342 / ORS 2060) TaxID=460265 RepID=B8IB65_METNO|nr:hypothetical protein Mnod_2304 [Methylobacterium nodulans ORS 2060]
MSFFKTASADQTKGAGAADEMACSELSLNELDGVSGGTGWSAANFHPPVNAPAPSWIHPTGLYPATPSWSTVSLSPGKWGH